MQFGIAVVERRESAAGVPLLVPDRMAVLELTSEDGAHATRVMLNEQAIDVLLEQLAEAKKAIGSSLVGVS